MTSLVILLLFFFFCLLFIATMLRLNKLHGLESYTMGSGSYWQITSLMLSFDQGCYLRWKKRNCWLVQDGKMIKEQRQCHKLYFSHTLISIVNTFWNEKSEIDVVILYYFACVVLQYVEQLLKLWSLIITFVFACLSCMLRIHQKHYMSHNSVIMSKDFHAI